MRPNKEKSEFETRIRDDGTILYFRSGRWHTWEAVEKARARSREKANKNRVKLNEDSRKRYHRLGYAAKQRRLAIRRRERNPVTLALLHKRSKAKQIGVDFNLTEDWYLAHYSGGCDATGVEFDAPISEDGGAPRSPWSAEIDRIKPGGSYTMDNCRLVCAIYNRAKMNYADADVEKMASSLLEWKNGR